LHSTTNSSVHLHSTAIMSLEKINPSPVSQLVDQSESSAAGAPQTPADLDAANTLGEGDSAPASTHAKAQDAADAATSESASATPSAAPLGMFKAMFRRKGGNDQQITGSQAKKDKEKTVKVSGKKKSKDGKDDKDTKDDKDGKDDKKKKPDPKKDPKIPQGLAATP